MIKILKGAAALAIAAATFGAAPSNAMPMVNAAPAMASSHDTGLIDVQYRGRGFGRNGYGGRGYGGRGYGRGYGGRGYGGRGYGIGAGLAGFATGAIIGSAIARPAPAPVYVVPAGGDPVAYCLSRFRSYSPATGTYTGFDGYAHRCP